MRHLRVLGTLELVESGGGAASLGSAGPAASDASPLVLSPRLRRLLAGLVVRANAVVSIDWLADVVWGEALPTNTEAAMHNLVSRLRTALSAGGTGGPTLLTRAPGYYLEIGAGQLDAAQFTGCAAAGRQALRADPERAADLLDEALALWRGPAYAEYADEDFARADAARLEAGRSTALEDRVEAALALGAHDEAIGRLEPVLAQSALRERPHAQMMLALHRAGRPAEALATYRRFRVRLDEELGLEPSPELVRLETQILRQDEALRWVAPEAGAPEPPHVGRAAAPVDGPEVAPIPMPTPGPPPSRVLPPVQPALPAAGPDPASTPVTGNLPAVLPTLVGRDELAAELTRALAGTRVLTLTGAGGIGKTSLALRVATDAAGKFPDGAWVVELASVQGPADVVDAVSTVLFVQQREGQSVAGRLVEFLRPKRLLLVLDNCEHVVESVARLVDRLAREGAQGVTVLATSREPLGVDEQVHPIPPLAVPAVRNLSVQAASAVPAVALFLERARAVAPGFEMSEGNVDGVVEICRRLDGLPLALELAAARMRSMTPAEAVERLGTRFQFLRSSRRIAAERHRTLRAVVDWSYGLLEEAERDAFDRLAVFVGDFSFTAAQVVAGADPDDTADLLEALVDRSMLLAVPSVDGTTRFSMLETMRAYGLERLAERGEIEAVRRRHAECITALTEEAARGLAGPECRRHADAIAAAFDDLRLAHSFAIEHDHDLGLRLVAALIDYGEMRMPQEVFAWAERTARAAIGNPPLLPVAWALAAAGARFAGGLDRAVRWATAALADVAPEDPVRRFPIYVLCEVALFQGRLEALPEMIAEAERLGNRAADVYRPTMALLVGGLARTYSGDADGARALLGRARVYAERSQSPSLLAWVRYAEGEALANIDPARSIALQEDALARAREVDDRYLTGVALVSVAGGRYRHGEPRDALPLFGDVIRHWHEAGNWTQQWITMRSVIDLLTRVGEPEAAAVLLGATSGRTGAAPAFGADAERLVATEMQLRDRLGGASVDLLRAQGTSMSDEDVVRWARGALERAGKRSDTGKGSDTPVGMRAFQDR